MITYVIYQIKWKKKNRLSGKGAASFSSEKGFTFIEVMMALMIFSIIILITQTFLQRTRVEVGTVTNQSVANDRCATVLNWISSDLRAAKRGTLEFEARAPIEKFAFLKYIPNKDEKKSDKIAVAKVEYRFDKASRKIFRTVYSVSFNKKGEFETGPPVEKMEFDNFSSLELLPRSEDGTKEHVYMCGVRVATEVENPELGHPQLSCSQTTVYIRDESYYQKQPHWNDNALYTSSLVSITQGKLLLPDFSDFTKAWTWVTDLKNKIPEMLDDVGQQIFESARAQLAEKIFARTDELKQEFQRRSNFNAVIEEAKKKIVGEIYKAFGNDRKFAVGAMFIRDALYNPQLGETLKNKVFNRTLTAEDIRKMVLQYNHPMFFDPYRIPRLDQSDFDFLEEYRTISNPTPEEVARKQRIDQAISSLTNDIYASIGTETGFKNVLAAFQGIMTRTVSDIIRDRALDFVADDVVDRTIDQLYEKAKTNLKEKLGINKALETANLDPRIKQEIENFMDELFTKLDKGILRIKETVKKEIKTGVEHALLPLSRTAIDSINQAKQSGEGLVRDLDVNRIADGLAEMKDPVSNAIINCADQILSGKTFDPKMKEFVDQPGAIDYLDRVFTDFGFPPPRGTTGI